MNLSEFALNAFTGPKYEVGKTQWIFDNVANISSYYAMGNVRLDWPMPQKMGSSSTIENQKTASAVL